MSESYTWNSTVEKSEEEPVAKDKSTKEAPVAEEEAVEVEALPTDALTADETAQKRAEYEESLKGPAPEEETPVEA